ncbi:MAG: hypothetical protein V5A64_04060 [Candidatus Thermoplasmatota archaeon]
MLKKFVAVLIASLLVTTLLPTVFSQNTFTEENDLETIEENNFEVDKSSTDDLSTNIDEKVEDTTKNTEDNSDGEPLGIREYIKEKVNVKADAGDKKSLYFYTNYSGIEKRTKLKFFFETKIDVNNDDKKDIGVRYWLYPGIEKPFSLSINFKLTIRQLSGFDSLDDEANFENHVELYFLGIILKSNAGDRLRFGYESPDGEKIPEKCEITYKLVPHILSIRNKPEHKFRINPDSQTRGSSRLNLIYSFSEMDNDKVNSEILTRVKYNPVVDSEITFHRAKKDKATVFEYKRATSEDTSVDMYVKRSEGENSTYAYALDTPSYVSFLFKLRRDGKIEFNTDGESADEIGVCDDLEKPDNKIYFTNLCSKAGISWYRDRFLFINKGKTNFSVYSNGEDVGANAYLKGSDGGYLDFQAVSHNPLDSSMELDLSEGYFRLVRSETDLELSLESEVKNDTLANMVTSVKGSLHLKRNFDGPFEIRFDEIKSGRINVTLSGKSFNISDFNFQGSSPLIGGNLSIEMDELVKYKQGQVSFDLEVEQTENNISGVCIFDVENGVEISNLAIYYNGAEVYRNDSIAVVGDFHREFGFSINISLEWHVHENWGYVTIRSGSLAAFSFNSVYRDEITNEVIGEISGSIEFEVPDEEFNVSWEKIDGNLSFYIDGSAVAGLKDFNFWIKDKVDVSIPEISVGFELNTYSKQGNLSLYMDDSALSCNVTINRINISDLFDVTLKGGLNVVLAASASGSVNIGWNESGITSINGEFGADATGLINLTDFEFQYKSLVDISMSQLLVSGDLDFNFSSVGNKTMIYADAGLTDVVISDLNVYASIVNPLAVSADMDITFDGSGYINVTYSNDTVIVNGAVYDDSNITINSLWFVLPIPSLPIQINLKSLSICGPTTLLFDVDTSKDTPFMATFISEKEIIADTIYVGYPGILQIHIYDFIGGGSDGSMGVGLNTATKQPVFNLQQTSCYIGNLQFSFGGNLLPFCPISNISFNGTANIEGFLDIAELKYVYLRGEILEDTTITLNDINIPMLGSGNFSLVFEPGEADLVLTQNMLDNPPYGDLYLYGYSSGWINVKFDDQSLVKAMGTMDIWVGIHKYDDGTLSAIIDAKEFSGAAIVANSLRFAGELYAKVEFSIKINKDEGGNTTVSNLNVNIEGNLSAVVQTKTNNSDWIPIIPFSTSGQVVLLRQAPAFMNPPNIADDFTVTTPDDNESLIFEAWYAPPLGKDSEDIGPYTYNLSFGDGTFYEVTTNQTRIVTNSHLYNLGSYNTSVTVTPSNSSIDPVTDSLSFEILKKITYLEVPETGPLNFLYSDVEEDGRIHTWFTIHNKDTENYQLEWQAEILLYGFEDPTMNPVVNPSSGVLQPNQTVHVNVSFYPPLDHKDHGNIYISADNTNYSGPGEDGVGEAITIKQSLSLIPETLYLPEIEPGEERENSFWIHNNKKETLNWTITDYPNEFYSFSKTSGSIPAGGAEIVDFTINAPEEDNVTLDGDIEVTDTDNSANVATFSVVVGILNQNNSGNGNITVSEDGNGNVSIAIGGSNEIHINNFQYEINGVTGEINGSFIFDTNNSYVYINFTQGNFLQTFSVDGTAEFTIHGFRFCYGDNINVEVSKVITGGIHWYEGKSGNFTVAVDDTFKEIDIDVSFNQTYTNFTFAGNIDIDISGETNGSLWINWDFNNETKDVTVDGDIFRDYNADINITDLKLIVNNFTFTSSLIHFNRTVDLYFNETGLNVETGGVIELDDIYFELEFNGDNWGIYTESNIDVIMDGFISFTFYEEEKLFCIHTEGYLYIGGILYATIGDFYIEITGNITMNGNFTMCYGPGS